MTPKMWERCRGRDGACCVHEGRTSVVPPGFTGRAFGCCWCNQWVPEAIAEPVPPIPEPPPMPPRPPYHGPLHNGRPQARRR